MSGNDILDSFLVLFGLLVALDFESVPTVPEISCLWHQALGFSCIRSQHTVTPLFPSSLSGCPCAVVIATAHGWQWEGRQQKSPP